MQALFTVNLGELRRACRRLVSRLSDESEIGTDFALFHATGMAMELSTGNSSEVLAATIHSSGQATVPRPVFSKLVSALRYFRGTIIEFEFSAGMIVLMVAPKFDINEFPSLTRNTETCPSRR